MTVVPDVLAGCEPMSHRGVSDVGVVVVHGFTGAPASVRGVADAMAAAGHHVELPRLPGHGTTIDDMCTTRWADWYAETCRAADAVAERADRLVLIGQSMGGTLALAAALERSDVDGVVVVNPATRLRDAATIEMLDELIADGLAVAPGEGSDIADPDASDVSYDGTPLAPLRSLLSDGIASITARFGDASMPLLAMTSRQDHVVDPADSEHLVASWGGPAEHVWLERSYHVATRDFDRGLVEARALAFVAGLGR